MSMYTSIMQLPEDVLFYILRHCEIQELVALGSTCNLFYRLTRDDLLWKHICCRDFELSEPDLGRVESYWMLYTNLLHKYGWMLGVYQSQIGPCGGLLEVRYRNGSLEGIQWEPSSAHDVMSPLKEMLVFIIHGDVVPAFCLCIPHIHPHTCTFSIDKWKGIVTQHCSNSDGHIQAVWENAGFNTVDLHLEPRKLQLIFLNEVIGNGLTHMPLRIPGPSDIPTSLRTKDGSFPQQIIAPGLFQGTYASHGLEIILFRYKDENEIYGHKVTGDTNVYASRVSVKILIKQPVSPDVKEQKSLELLKAMEARMSDKPISQIPEQPFIPPDGTHRDCSTPLLSTCKARYHGFGQVAYVWYQRPSFTPIQVIVFNNDLLGVLWLELESFSLFSRIKKTFTPNSIKVFESVV